ncbi:integral membrane protein [Coniochaeta sp. 2T2.1]|nr:integral membrane protein [Coniochaeta sp. 2T2.1]
MRHLTRYHIWDASVPPLLRPLVRAYILGYLSSVVSRLPTLLGHILQALRQQRSLKKKGSSESPVKDAHLLDSLKSILLHPLHWQRFPTFCAALVGGSTLLEIPLRRLFKRLAGNLSPILRIRLSRWFSSFIAAYFSIQILQSKPSLRFQETVPVKSDSPPGVASKTVRHAGRTLDLTLFAATQALDVAVGELWHCFQKRRRAAGHPQSVAEKAISRLVDPAMFAVSSGLVMWAWFYTPSRLPRTYNKWITSAAAVDNRLIEALRRCHYGVLRYGEDTGQAPLLGGMAADHNLPAVWGDPAISIPFPCDIVHMGVGPSCELHLVSRFVRSFKWAMATYLPLNLLLVARRPNGNALIRALLSSIRSSTFLGTFIALFYYGVCLARSRIGPRILGKHTSARQAIDGGICVATGCFLCGWSILIENAGRRKAMALFVAPRALATMLPRRYALDKQGRETFVFAFSTAVVFSCFAENRHRVRGMLGSVLGTVLKQ